MVCLMLWHQYLRNIQRLKQQAMDPVMFQNHMLMQHRWCKNNAERISDRAGCDTESWGYRRKPRRSNKGTICHPSAAVVSSASILLVEFSRAFGNSVMFFGFICRLYPVKLFETINQFSENHVLVKKKITIVR